MRGFGACGAAVAVVAMAFLSPGAVVGAPGIAVDPTAGFPTGWSHAEINVVGSRGKAHTQIYDRGRVKSVAASALTLKENDGSTVKVRVARAAVVTLNGRSRRFSELVPRSWVWTLSIDGLPAERVVGTLPSQPPPQTQLQPQAPSQSTKPPSEAENQSTASPPPASP